MLSYNRPRIISYIDKLVSVRSSHDNSLVSLSSSPPPPPPAAAQKHTKNGDNKSEHNTQATDDDPADIHDALRLIYQTLNDTITSRSLNKTNGKNKKSNSSNDTFSQPSKIQLSTLDVIIIYL